mmetsp:Transcript_7971/g.11443  ORF Transcript_7971/g.11443 Transcript_7971/m.11443 type:complete len:203 (+) Transcript_7971:121-729(+)
MTNTTNNSNAHGRKVRFNSITRVGIATSYNNLTQEERHNVWYQQSELGSFKDDARDIAMVLDTNVVVCQLGDTVTATKSNGQHMIDCTRGLERLRSVRRLQDKIIARRVIMKAMKRFQTDLEKVALVAHRCTQWSRQVALLTAKIDYHSAYDISLPSQTVPVHPFERKENNRCPSVCKRQALSCEMGEHQRIKRQRVVTLAQ